eukprot:TRINITY_DN644_c0_g1_i2.p1 TRINITY_DN644_c0_g1~~TRINITY_DN644_c0_g1_i2.p1  ORF type:complete len:568 (-),score=53.01 TRINITY_DN644_c0_g1_i2:200-1903(-)
MHCSRYKYTRVQQIQQQISDSCMDLKKRSNSTPFDTESMLTLRELEEYIRPTKEKMRGLYSALFESAQKQDNTETEKANALLYKNLMIEASRGIKALEECTLLVNVDKTNIISKKLAPEQIKECPNSLLKRCLHIPRAIQALKLYLLSLELADVEPTIKALLINDRECRHVVSIRKLLKSEMLKEYQRAERIKRRVLMEQLRHRQAGEKSVMELPKEYVSIMRVMSERQALPNKKRLASVKKQQNQKMAKESHRIETQLKHLKFEIDTMHVRDQRAFKSQPRVAKSIEVENANKLWEESYREKYKKSCKELYYPSECKVFETIVGSHRQLPGPLGCLYFKYSQMRDKLRALSTERDNKRSLVSRSLVTNPSLHKVEAKVYSRKSINTSIQKHRKGGIQIRSDVAKLLNESRAERGKSRNSLSFVPLLQRKIINTQEQSKAERLQDIIENCDNAYKCSARDVIEVKKHECSVADLYRSLQEQIEKTDNKANISYFNSRIEESIRNHRKPQKCFIYGPKGQGRYIYNEDDGKIKDLVRETDVLLDPEIKKRREYRIKKRLNIRHHRGGV